MAKKVELPKKDGGPAPPIENGAIILEKSPKYCIKAKRLAINPAIRFVFNNFPQYFSSIKVAKNKANAK